MTSSSQIYMWCMLLTIGLLVFVLNIDYTAVNLALLPIAEEIQYDLNSLQWLLSGYVLTWGAVVVPAGRLADIYGRKRVLVAGLVIFMIGSAMTGAGYHIFTLIGGRIFQGIGAAIFTAPAMSLIFTSAPATQQGLAMGVISSFSGFGLATGPTLAGWIIKSFGWRWIFYINIPLSLAIIGIILYLAPEDKTSSSAPKIDKVNTLLLSGGLGSFMFALNQIEIWGLKNQWFWLVLILGLILIGLFLARDKNLPFQILPRTLLKNKSFMSLLGAIFGTAYSFSLILVMVSLYLQNTLKMTSLETGYTFLAMTLAVGLLSPVGGKLIDLIEIRIPLLSAFVLIVNAMLMMSFFTETTSRAFIFVALFLAGLGIGFNFPAMNTAMFRTIEPTDINTGSAIFIMCAMLGNTLSVILSTSFVVIFGRSELANLLANENFNLMPSDYHKLANVITKVEHTAEQLSGFADAEIPALLRLIDLAFLKGMRINMWIAMGLLVLSALLIYRFLKLKSASSTAQPTITHV